MARCVRRTARKATHARAELFGFARRDLCNSKKANKLKHAQWREPWLFWERVTYDLRRGFHAEVVCDCGCSSGALSAASETQNGDGWVHVTRGSTGGPG
jgi:hypothetical protein